MTEEFNKWWDNDLLTQNNPYVDGTPAFWAWEGWCAAVKAEREACAKVCEAEAEMFKSCAYGANDGRYDWKEDGARDCASAIRARGDT